ncbi:MAG: hypothetical protein HC831_15070 [Chloroflexia bacterium]|nr:hypothetical protein [Chloroflexia bacterium]
MLHKLLLFVFVLCSGTALSQADSLVIIDSLWFDQGARFYDVAPCGGCPDKFKQENMPKMFMENPYQYENNNSVIVLPDSLIKEFQFIFPELLPPPEEKEVVPVI